MKSKTKTRERRKIHIRKKVSGSMLKPRVFVFKSNKYFYSGIVDDDTAKTLISLRVNKGKSNVKILGKDMAAKLLKIKVTQAVFDRSGYKYHGLVANYVESLRSNGIKI